MEANGEVLPERLFCRRSFVGGKCENRADRKISEKLFHGMFHGIGKNVSERSLTFLPPLQIRRTSSVFQSYEWRTVCTNSSIFCFRTADCALRLRAEARTSCAVRPFSSAPFWTAAIL